MRPMRRLILAALLSALPQIATATSPPEIVPIPVPNTGWVSAADPRAEAAGQEILAKGGNATDAAIAVMLALTVVEPQSSGIGGGGLLVRGDAAGQVTSFNGRETAPKAATPSWFLNADGSLPPLSQSVKSGLSVGVPGNIALAAAAHKAYGKLPWAQLFEPAIKLARDGFRVNPRLYTMLSASQDVAARYAGPRALFYTKEGQAKPVGDTIRNAALAKTFENIAAKGPAFFYKGKFARDMAAAIAAATPHKYAMRSSDFAAYTAPRRDALCGTYRAYRICAMGPPTSGGIAVLQILGMLERFDIAQMGKNDPRMWHLFIEAQRLAYADREHYIADDDFVSVPSAGLIDKGYLTRRSALISLEHSIEKVSRGMPDGAPLTRADGNEAEEHGTSHIAVVDGDETMVSYTSTIEAPFGSGLFYGGFFLNNELTDFSRNPTVDGVTVANSVGGGKRPRSSMAPVVVWDPTGRPVLAVGAAGGQTIPVQTARAVIGVIDFGLSAQDALGLPFIMALDNRILVEQGTWLEASIATFKALGHDHIMARPAPVKGGAILRRGNTWENVRDPRIADQLILP